MGSGAATKQTGPELAPPRRAAEPPASDGEVVRGERRNRPRRDDRPHSGPNRRHGQAEGRRPRPEGAEAGQRQGGRPHADSRRDRNGRGGERNENRGGKARAWSSAERPQRERQPDPDSPFAKLLALKAELEAKAKKE